MRISHYNTPDNSHNPVKLTYVSPYDRKIKRVIMALLERIWGGKKIDRLYSEIRETKMQPEEIWRIAVEKLDLKLVYNEDKLLSAPKEGPLVIISNHPFGVVDGLVLGYLAARIRMDFVVLVNEVIMGQDERIDNYLLPIDFRESKDAVKANIQTKNKTLARLANGEALVIFPSGGVATSPKGFGKAEDLEWKRFVAKVIQQSKATVIPVFFHGQNSRLFQLVSQVSATLRLSMLLHEVKNKIGKPIRLEIGDPISYEEISHIRDRQKLLNYLWQVTHDLGKAS
ncbi:MAG: lysophospholipid acyltransferase family protein [Bacteroidota bacterium]